MFVLFVGASKAENADISEGNVFIIVYVRKMSSVNKLCFAQRTLWLHNCIYFTT